MTDIATPITRALAVLASNNEFMDLTEEEGYVDTGDAFEQLHALRACIHELMLKPGTRVRMTDECKATFLAAQQKVAAQVLDEDKGVSPHVEEFGDCIGTVIGPADFTGPSCQIKQLGPEIDVRWQPSNLRYMYKPEHLEIVK